jgi:hypothetical protein
MTYASCVAKLEVVVRQQFEGEVKEAVDKTAEDIFKSSTERYCPVDTGNLKASCRTEKTESGSKYTRTISYDTTRTSSEPTYAHWVHNIPYHHEHGSWKYLAIPFNVETSKLMSNIKGKVRL